METQLTEEKVRKIVISELPKILKYGHEMHRFVMDITANKYADREKTEDRFDRILDELKQDREKSEKRWKALEKKWEAQEKKWEAQEKKWEGQEEKREVQEKKWETLEKKWEGQEKRWEGQEEKWEAQEKRWEAQERKWEKNQEVINRMLESVEALSRKHDATIGALGSRWGLHSESSFRNGLRTILEDSFSVKVERYQDFDHEGTVFGKPDQIEMDVIIHNGTLILCEIKSSMSKSDMYVFSRKKEFYEKKHDRKAKRILVISPMVEGSAAEVAKKLGIEVFSYADSVKL